MKPSWIGTGNTNDNSDHNTKSTIILPTKAKFTGVVTIGSNSSASITITAIRFDNIVNLVLPIWNVNGTPSGGTATFDTVLSSTYRPKQQPDGTGQNFMFVVTGTNGGGAKVPIRLSVLSNGTILWKTIDGEDLIESAHANSTSVSYIL